MIAPQVTTTVTWECVHIGRLSEGRAAIEVCRERGLNAFVVDVTDTRDKEKLLTDIAEAMNFPSYFGKNWDALNECLCDLSWLNPKGILLVLEGAEGLWCEASLSGPLIETWLSCAESWAENKIPFHLAFTWD